MGLRNFFDKLEPSFSKGGKYERYFPIYEMIESLAFTSEIRGPDRRIYLQRFYHATPLDATADPSPSDPDDEIEDAAFLPLTALGSTLTYRPRVEPLREWLRDRKPRHYTYDLTSEPSHVDR